MNPVNNESATALLLGEYTQRAKTSPSRSSATNEEFAEIDIIDVLAFLWRIRHSIVGGILIGLLAGTIHAISKKPRTVPVAPPPPAELTPLPTDFRNEFLILERQDYIDGKYANRLNKLNELLAQPRILETFFRSISRRWPEIPKIWAGQTDAASLPDDPILFEAFLVKQAKEKLISLSSLPGTPGILLSLSLPMKVEKSQLRSVITEIIEELNSNFIAPMNRNIAWTNEHAKEQIIAIKSEILRNKSRLNKLYYSLIKVSPVENPSIRLFINDENKSQIEKISSENALTLVSILSAEGILTARAEAEYSRILVDIQIQMEELPQQIAIRNGTINLTPLLLLSVAPLQDQASLANNRVIALPGQTPALPTIVPPPSATEIPKTKSWILSITLGLLLGFFAGITVGGIRLFLRNNWDRIKESIHE